MQWLGTVSVYCMTAISFLFENMKMAIHGLLRFAPSRYVTFSQIVLDAQTTPALFSWHMLIVYSRRPTLLMKWAARTEPFAAVWKICGDRASSRRNAPDTTELCGFISRKMSMIILHHRKPFLLDFGNNFRTESFSGRFGNNFRSHRKNFPFRFGNIFRLVPYTVSYTIPYHGLCCYHTREGETLRAHRVVDRRGEVYHLDGFLHRIGKAGLPAIPSESTR